MPIHGAVLRAHPVTHKVQRLDFRETEMPCGLYVNRDEMRLVIPSRTEDRAAPHYTVYSSRSGQARASNMLPPARQFTFYPLQ